LLGLRALKQTIAPVQLKTSILNGAYLLGGSAGRLGLGGIYFAALVNVLSLAEYGVFASALATALIIANGGTFGFNAPLFRAAATRPRIVGAYTAGVLAYALGTIPFILALAFASHVAILSSFISLGSLIAIVLSEALCARLVLTIQDLNLGLGRYGAASAIGLLPQFLRLLAVGVFWLAGLQGLDNWARLYFGANLVALAFALTSLPGPRLRWRWKIVIGRLPEAYAFASVSLVLALQTEADKLLVLVMTSPETAGLYALTMRVVDLVTTPVRVFFPIYARRLMQRPELIEDRRIGIAMEFGVGAVATVLFILLLQALSLAPTLLGANIGAARTWFAGLLLIPAAKLLTDLHRYIYFATNRLYSSAAIALLLLGLRVTALALIIFLVPNHTGWIIPLNVLFLFLYLVSAGFTWRFVYGSDHVGRQPKR
jgi:O-antigen/teichoic acid export membrane protein